MSRHDNVKQLYCDLLIGYDDGSGNKHSKIEIVGTTKTSGGVYDVWLAESCMKPWDCEDFWSITLRPIKIRSKQ